MEDFLAILAPFAERKATLAKRLAALTATLGLLIVFSLGCDRDPMVRVYDAPKDPVKAPPPRMTQVQGPTRFLIAVVPVGKQVYFLKASERPDKLEGLEPALKEIAGKIKADDKGEIDWGLPEGWLKKPGTGPVVSAVLQSPVESGSINFTVTELAGPPTSADWDGYLEVNINRWRGQLSLPPNSIAEQKPDLVKIDREGSEPAWLVDLRTADGQTADASASNPKPEASSNNSSPTNSASTSKLKYKTPDGWTDEGAKGMRIASFAVVEGESKGEVTVIIAGGDRQANVDRWQGQVSPDAKSEKVQELAKQAVAEAKEVKSAGDIVGSLYTLRGPNGDNPPTMLAAILPLEAGGSSSVFVKLTGDAKLAEAHRERLIQFIESLEW